MDESEEPLGLRYGNLRLVRPNPAWMGFAAELRTNLAALLGDHVIDIEHIGSTSVSGLVCKPILDFAVGLPGTTDDVRIRPVLTDAGWIYRGDAGDSGGHIYVLESEPGIRIAHLHGVEHRGPQWNRYLHFRQRLLGDAAARSAYSEAKLTLLDKYGHINSREAYTEGKTQIVLDLLKRV